MKKIYCPYCNLRLFDARGNAKGDVEIKCSRCRKVVKVELTEALTEFAAFEKEMTDFMRQLDSVAL